VSGSEAPPLVPWPDELTRREKQIAQLVCDGLTRRAIVRLLGIGGSTFDTHRHEAMRKLGVQNEVQLVRKALAHRWVTLDAS
jgi:DNA-binding CsgD family transcriptional regulator